MKITTNAIQNKLQIKLKNVNTNWDKAPSYVFWKFNNKKIPELYGVLVLGENA